MIYVSFHVLSAISIMVFTNNVYYELFSRAKKFSVNVSSCMKTGVWRHWVTCCRWVVAFGARFRLPVWDGVPGCADSWSRDSTTRHHTAAFWTSSSQTNDPCHKVRRPLSLSISLSARSVFGRLLVLGWSRYSRYKFYLPHNAVRVRNMLPYSVTGNVASLSKPLYPLILFHRKSKTRYTCSLWWQ